MNSEFDEAVKKIKETSSITVTVHVQPDGDALGSLLALYRYLKKAGKKVCATVGEDMRLPVHYAWMPGLESITGFGECPDAELLVALDCANEHRLGLMEERLGRFPSIINMDHHIDNSSFGTINVLDFKAGATCEIVYELLRALDGDIDCDMATILYTGIVTDTGRFQYQNTTSRTLRIAADLVDLGAVPSDIFQLVYENLSFASLKLLTTILNRAEYVEEGELVYSYILNEDLKQAGAVVADTENYIDYLRTAREACVAAMLKEMPDGRFRISLRSKGAIDVGAIARAGGGGGHRNAAGVTLDKTIEEAVMWLTEKIKPRKATTTAG